MTGPQVVILDEFQYFGQDEVDLAAVASELNAVWEARRPPRPFVLVLSGSAVGVLEAMAGGAAPLYGRFAWIGKLQPFDYWHSNQLASFAALRDRVRCYAAFGGTPRFLAAIDTTESIDANIARLLLDGRGEVRTLIETALVQERGLRDVQKYQAVLRAIGTGNTTLARIQNDAGLQQDASTSVRRIVDRLIDLGYVRATRNIGAPPKAPFRYRIDDPAFAFYYEFVTRFESAIVRNNALDVWNMRIASTFDSYVGHIFERMAEQAFIRLHSTLDIPLVTDWGKWEGQDRNRESIAVDIVAPLINDGVLTGSVKWNRAPLPVQRYFEHLSMLDRLAKSGVAWAVTALRPESPLLWVAAGGFTPAFVEVAQEDGRRVVLWDIETMYGVG